MKVKLVTVMLCPECKKSLYVDNENHVFCDNDQCKKFNIEHELPEVEIKEIVKK